ncbi:hypothetical protein C5167_026899 [Papaver somniferum]|uniref:uncharacterized protein LOC113341319 isoform X2 n=1 Tax=Papaver somniferum TaxID=3469 RepID=UPI000E6F9A07|nr:uncharacterized protein LOC113341319 isoform X2 [Papaver somniferum]RZC92265.1 hypothetical protein C5167_026899 [Papaver somniferum]
MARCSIELEPRTLNELELNVAREAAVDIVLNSGSGSNELASKLLPERLRPMFSLKEIILDDNEEEEQQDSIANWYKENSGTSKTNSGGKSKVVASVNVKLDNLQMGCDPNCACNVKPISIRKSPNSKYRIREPVSAPF